MKKCIIHISIWIVGVIACIILKKIGYDLNYGVMLLWTLCALFFMANYIYMFMNKKNDTKVIVSNEGVFSGRVFGIFFNMFTVQYLLELYKNMKLCGILSVISIVILLMFHKDVKIFLKENVWKASFLEIYISFTILFASVYSIIGYFYEEALIVNIEQVSLRIKCILIVVYIMLSVFSVFPNSFIMKIATKNEQFH